MSSEVLVPLKAVTRNDKQLEFQLKVRYWSDKERMRRALKMGGLSLGLAVAFVFVPIAHFFLVPLTLLITPLIMYFIHKQKLEVPPQNISCPSCTTEVNLPPMTSLQETEILCDKCRQVLHLKWA